MERTILHINVVNFYVAVARALEPKTSGFPLAVRAAGSHRVLIDVSSEARAAGVWRGMSAESAKRQCPDLQILDPQPKEYVRAQDFLLEQATRLSPLAEVAGPGHLFIDLTGTRRLLGPSVDVADSLQKEIKLQCRFDTALGVASNRLVSKVATRVIKPVGLCTIMTGCEEEFLAPLPVSFLPGIEPKILEHLTQFNLRLIKDLNKIPASTLATALGPSAYEISRHSRGIDDTPVRESILPAPSIRESLTLGEQTNDEYEIGAALFHLVTVGAAKVRKLGLAVAKIKLSVLYADGMESSKTVKLQIPLRGDLSIYEQCQILLKKIFTRRVRITVLSAEFLDLIFPYGQIDLFMDSQREENLMTAIDSIRNSFGEKAIKFWGRQQVA